MSGWITRVSGIVNNNAATKAAHASVPNCSIGEFEQYQWRALTPLLLAARWYAPQPAFLSLSKISGTEDFLDKALVIVNALGFNFFESLAAEPPPEKQQPGHAAASAAQPTAIA